MTLFSDKSFCSKIFSLSACSSFCAKVAVKSGVTFKSFHSTSDMKPKLAFKTVVLSPFAKLPLAFNGRHFQVEQFSIGHFPARHGSRRQGLLGRCEASTAPLANPGTARGLSAVSRVFPPNARCERGAGGVKARVIVTPLTRGSRRA